MILKPDHGFQKKQDYFAQVSNNNNLEISVVLMTLL